MLFKRITDEVCQKLSDFLEKTSYFNAIGIHFARVLSYLKELDFLTFQSQLKKLNR